MTTLSSAARKPSAPCLVSAVTTTTPPKAAISTPLASTALSASWPELRIKMTEVREAGLGSFWAGLLRDCGIGRKNKRDFGIEKKSGSGFGHRIARDYGKCTKIWRDIGIKIGNGIGIKRHFL